MIHDSRPPQTELPAGTAGDIYDTCSPAGEQVNKSALEPSSHLGATAIGEPDVETAEPWAEIDSKNAEEDRKGVVLLNDMRAYFHSTMRRTVPVNANVPSQANTALHYLLRIDRREPQAQDRIVRPLDIKKLFLNLHAYIAQERPQDLIQLSSLEILKQIYDTYITDVTRFQNEKIPRPAYMAILHSSALFDRLTERYSQHPFINKTAIRRVFDIAPRNPEEALQKLDTGVKDFKATVEPSLRSEYGIEGDWDLVFIRTMLQSSPDAETVARTILGKMQSLLKTYPHIHPERAAAWAETQVFPRRGPALAKGVEEETKDPPASILYGKEKLEKGREQLGRIRTITRRPPVARGRHSVIKLSEPMAALAELTNKRQDIAFTALTDISFETMRLESAVQAYNSSLKEDEAHLKIDMETETLYAIFLAYALDVGAFQQKGYGVGASTVAWYHDVGVYDRYIAAYEGKEGATAAEIVEVIRYRPTEPDRQIEGLLIRKRMEL